MSFLRRLPSFRTMLLSLLCCWVCWPMPIAWGQENVQSHRTQVQALTTKASEALLRNDVDQAIMHGIEAVNLSLLADHEITAHAMVTLAKAYERKQDFPNALDFAVQALAVLEQTSEDLDKTEAHLMLGRIYLAWKIYPKAVDHLEEAYQLQQQAGGAHAIEIMQLLGDAHWRNRNPSRATVLFQRVQEQADAASPWRAMALQRLSSIEAAQGKHADALLHAHAYRSLLANSAHAHPEALSLALQDIGFLHRQLLQHDSSVHWLQAALAAQPLPIVYTNLGISHTHAKQYDLATRALARALASYQMRQDHEGEARCYNYLAANEHVQGQHQHALELAEQALALARQHGLTRAAMEAYQLQSEIYTALGDYRRSQQAYRQYNEASQQVAKAEQALRDEGQHRAIAAQDQENHSRMMVADKEKQLLQLRQAKLESEKQAKELALLTQERNLQEAQLRNEALEKDRAEQQLAYAKAQLRASQKEREVAFLEREQEKQRLQIAQQQMLEAQKQAQLDLLQKENVLLEQKKRLQDAELAQNHAQQQYANLTIATVSLLLLAALIAFIWSRRQQRIIASKNQELEAQKEVLEMQQAIIMEKNEELQTSEEEIRQNAEELLSINEQMQSTLGELQKQKSLVDHKNLNIMSSINYAKRIQQAMLPHHSAISGALPQSFLFYLPRDVVSGDFYWFHSSDTHIFIATVDCTGHGVPGAFMSLIGNALLREAIIDKKITDPGKVLDLVHVGVTRGLRQEETDSKDGMDASLCVIDKVAHKLYFAGAHNPLIYIQQGELHEVRGDRYSIGGRKKLYAEHFTTHEIDLSDSTACYIFSDGYQDQFGGPDGRKFMKRQLKERFLQIHQKPFREQGQFLEDLFFQWLGQERQIDDVLVIGFQWPGKR